MSDNELVFNLTEHFLNSQGEGVLTGTPSVFLRFAGCNLRCDWCDTMFSSWYPNDVERYTSDEMVDIINGYGVKHIVLTGGEPMIHKDAVKFINDKFGDTHHITIETAGTIFNPELTSVGLASVSPKLLSSIPSASRGKIFADHKDKRKNNEVLNSWLTNDSVSSEVQLKFVVSNEDDLNECVEWIKELPMGRVSSVCFQPNGLTEDLSEYLSRGVWLNEMLITDDTPASRFFKAQSYPIRVLFQNHKLMYNNARRK